MSAHRVYRSLAYCEANLLAGPAEIRTAYLIDMWLAALRKARAQGLLYVSPLSLNSKR